MKFFSFLTIILLTCFTGNGQNLIGYSSKDIRDYMRVNRSEMNMEKVNNSTFRYLKYSDNNDSETILFFLTLDSICQHIRMVCNNSIRYSKIRELDTTYSRRGKNIWTDNHSGKNYTIKLVDEDWTFSVTIEPEK